MGRISLWAIVIVLAAWKSVFALDDFTMGVSTKHISVAYLYMGKERGFFAEEGIDLKLVLIPAYLAGTTLIGRQIDGVEFGSTGITLRANGAPVINVFSQSEKPAWFLLSNPAIKDLKQLSGKAVTVGVLGSGSHLATVEILKKAGVNPDSVVFMGGRGGSDIRIQMLAGGTVQAANLVPPYNFIAERMGLRELFFYGDYIDLAQFGLIVHESSLETRRPLIKRVLRAFLKSHIYSVQHRDETMKWVMSNLKVEKQDALKTVDVLARIATKNGIASDAAIQNALDPAAKRTRKDLVDYTLLREVIAEVKN
ncbi:MAG TPA: ABC transporter substrate-binding protein [Candidatus Binatia bacterium]|jgi:NitT/TauT family transport system substrate-binding protein